MPVLFPVPPPLTPDQVDAVFQSVTQSLLGIDAVADPDAANSAVRVGWQQEGQPSQDIKTDVCYVRSVEDDDETNRQRDIELNDIDANTIQQITTYQRVWRIYWTLEGPNCFDRARAIRSGLYTQVPHDIFAVRNIKLYFVMDPSAPRYLPEFRASQWWKRCDFDCQFNERVTEELVINSIDSTEVLIYTEASPDIDHPVADIIVTKP